METIRNMRRKLEDYSQVKVEYDEELDLSPQSAEKDESYYHDSRSSEDTQTAPLRPKAKPFVTRRPSNNRGLKFTIVALTAALAVVSTFHAILLLNRPHSQCFPSPPPLNEAVLKGNKQVIDCGASVPEAKAKGCSWDELTKAWLPAECPRYGIDEYRMEGIVNNPRENASSWPYYSDLSGEAEVNFNSLARLDDRDPNINSFTTTRQHLVHCVYGLKRVVWSYSNGYGVYDKISNMHHVNHCINQLYRRAIRKDDHDIDLITTAVNVHFGNCAL
jgi:hypothetical protein